MIHPFGEIQQWLAQLPSLFALTALGGATARSGENYRFHRLCAHATSGSRARLRAIVIARIAAMIMAKPSIASRVSSDIGHLSTINQKA